VKQEYVMPVNYYNFTWNPVPGASTYDIYGNNALIFHGSPLSFRDEIFKIFDAIESKTGQPIIMGDTVVFYLVARSNTNQVLAVSNLVRMRLAFYIAEQTPQVFAKSPNIRISGTVIDCSSLKGTARVTLYSLSGEKLWAKEGLAIKTMLPDQLPRGVYSMEIFGSFGKTSRVLVRQ
jgi:hypothetical protein